MAITEVTSTFNSSYEGVIGLSPPNTDEQNKRSFLTFAQKAGLITNRVFSYYNSLDPKIQSSIKFGSYDQSGLLPGSNFIYLKTRNITTWGIRGQQLYLGSQNLTNNEVSITALFEPQLPYMYIPQNDYVNFTQMVSEEFGQQIICT